MINQGAAVVEQLGAGHTDLGQPAIAGLVGSAGDRQGVGGAAQIHFVHLFEAGEAAEAVALHHQEHAAGSIEGHIADLVLIGAAAEQVQVLLDRGAGGGIDRQDAGELGGAAAAAGAVAVLVERALHEGIEQAVDGVEGHAFNTAIAPTVAIDGRQAVDRFSTDRAGAVQVVLCRQLGFLAGGNVTLDQVAGAEIEQGNLAAVFVAHGEHLAVAAADAHVEHRHGLRVDAERVVEEGCVGFVDGDIVFAGQLRQTGEGRALGTLQADASQFAHRASCAVHAQLVDRGLEIGVEELALAIDDVAIRASVGNRVVDVELGTVNRFLTGKGQTRKPTGQYASG